MTVFFLSILNRHGAFNAFTHMDYLNYRVRGSQLSSRVNAHDCSAFIILFADVSVCYVQACLSEHTLPVTLPGVVALTLSSLGAGPWLCRQR